MRHRAVSLRQHSFFTENVLLHRCENLICVYAFINRFLQVNYLGHQIISDDLNDLQNGTEICNFSPFCKSFSKNFSNLDPLPPQSGMSTLRTLPKVGCFVHISQGRFAAPVRPCLTRILFTSFSVLFLTATYKARKKVCERTGF